MLALLSNLNLVTRIEINVEEAVQEDLLQGFWVTAGGVKYEPAAQLDSTVHGGFQVWTEANRTMEADYLSSSGGKAIDALGSGHFTGDATGKVPETLTCLYGKYRALTNIYDTANAPSIGDPMFVDTNGLLSADATISGQYIPVAVCTKAAHTYNHIGKDFTCIE